MRHWARVLLLFCAAFLATGVLAQEGQDTPILRVNGQVLTRSDLDFVKEMLPLSRFKTTRGRENLIERIHVQFLVEKTLLEQQGMKQVTRGDVKQFLSTPRGPDLLAPTRSQDYSREGLAARQLFSQAYIKFISGESFSEVSKFFAPQPLENPETAIERAKTDLFLSSTEPFWVTAQAMLLPDLAIAKRMLELVSKKHDFGSLARKYSLVRAMVGGAYPGTERPERTSIEDFEPELQVAIANLSRPDTLIVPTAFQRYWLLQVMTINPPKPLTLQDYLRGMPWNGKFVLTGSQLGDGASIRNTNTPNRTVEALESTLAVDDPIIAKVQDDEVRLASAFAQIFLVSDPSEFGDIESNLAKEVSGWMQRSAVHHGIPFQGAGAEQGLEVYLAARVTVSDAQLKEHYRQHKKQHTFYQKVISCRFETKSFAEHFRKLFNEFPNSSWHDSLEYPNSGYCDTDGGSNDPPWPGKPSRTSLLPVPGGYITQVFPHESAYYFQYLYNFQPVPLVKPFPLVRNEIEKEYRHIVAKKRLPAFWQELKRRTNAQYLLPQVLQELERSVK